MEQTNHMASPQENVSMAVFCDFENVALGVRDAKIDRFDIKPVLERLLLKGSIVVKKAYCDWERYKGFKASMHEASFELIEIPHVRQSGKNSADIRLVVDALDLCYTKSHVDTFVIVSGDSDFSPLVSKLRENAKKVIGVGVRHSTSDLLVANCDEFIFYDDLVRELVREQQARGKGRGESAANAKRQGGDERQPKNDSAEDRSEERKLKAITLVVETLDALGYDRGDGGKIWASVLKSAIKRRRPDFSEARYGFRAFGNLLEEAQTRGLLEVGRDDKSGTFVTRTSPPANVASTATAPVVAEAAAPTPVAEESAAPRTDDTRSRRKGRRNGRGAGRTNEAARDVHDVHEAQQVVQKQEIFDIESLQETEAADTDSDHDLFTQPLSHESALPLFEPATPEEVKVLEEAPRRARKTASRKSPARKKATKAVKDEAQAAAAVETEAQPAAHTEAAAEATPDATAADAPKKKAPRKTPARARRPRKAAEES
jgi:uncharacterized protein (TIGR00288 family)